MAAARYSSGNSVVELHLQKDPKGRDSVVNDQPYENEINMFPLVIDELEDSVEFLCDIGLGEAVSYIRNGKEISQKLYSDAVTGLTPRQLTVVKTHINTVKVKSKTGRADVRDLFSNSSNGCESRRECLIEEQICEMKISNDDYQEGVDGGCHSIIIPPPDYNSSDEDGDPPQTKLPSQDKHLMDQSPMMNAHADAFNDMLKSNADDTCIGATYVDGLGKKDLKMLAELARIELATLLDDHGIKPLRHTTNKKSKDRGIFGVHLQVLLDRDIKKIPNIRVPLFFQQVIAHLEKYVDEEGLLRIPGSLARIRELRHEIDSKGKIDFESVNSHDLSGLFKQFLRDLPAPILTLEWVDCFHKLLGISDQKQQIYGYILLILLLPDVNRNCLQLLFGFLKKIIDHPSNRMTLENVAMVIAPNLFLFGSGKAKESELLLVEYSVRVVVQMLRHSDELWTIPPMLLSQVRLKNEQLAKKSRTESVGNLDKITLHFVDSKTEKSFNVVSLTTVNDLLSQSVRISRTSLTENGINKGSNFIVEVGGNIEFRRLDPCTNITSLYCVNPEARYFVVQTDPVQSCCRWITFH